METPEIVFQLQSVRNELLNMDKVLKFLINEILKNQQPGMEGWVKPKENDRGYPEL